MTGCTTEDGRCTHSDLLPGSCAKHLGHVAETDAQDALARSKVLYQ